MPKKEAAVLFGLRACDKILHTAKIGVNPLTLHPAPCFWSPHCFHLLSSLHARGHTVRKDLSWRTWGTPSSLAPRIIRTVTLPVWSLLLPSQNRTCSKVPVPSRPHVPEIRPSSKCFVQDVLSACHPGLCSAEHSQFCFQSWFFPSFIPLHTS